jgi:hypothetical protein
MNKKKGSRILGKSSQALKQKNKKQVCNPDFRLLVALGVPRSGFLAYFQPAGASTSLGNSMLPLFQEKRTKTTTRMHIFHSSGPPPVYGESFSFIWVPSF